MFISVRKIHKFSGLSAGIIILILSITGLFLNHDNWKFSHNITINTNATDLIKLNNRTYTSYFVNPNNSNHIVAGSSRGVYESFDGGKSFIETLDEVIYSIRNDKNTLFVATGNGLYKKALDNGSWDKYILFNKMITSLNIFENWLIAVEDKQTIFFIDLNKNLILSENKVSIPKEMLDMDISLSRFVRDLHYGRGLFDGEISLLINDFATIILIILAITGFVLWFLVKNIKRNNNKNKIKWFVKLHSNIFVILAIFPIIILLITGIFLDHGKDLNKFMKEVTIPNYILPPVYKSLKSDIWGADFDGENFYIGNRLGIYKTKDFYTYELISKGFAYSMIRKENVLYISGMGSSNRIFQNNKFENLLNSPHMFKDIYFIDGVKKYLSSHNHEIILPKFENITLYSFLYSLHDGSFFATWWIWINDLASILLLILLITGGYRWYLRSNLRRTIR